MADRSGYKGLSVDFYDHWHPGSFGREMEFIRERITRQGGKALEIACGTGRVMCPMLEAGLDVEGVDASTEMLERAREKAQARGLKPVLYQAMMQELDLKKTYSTVYVPGQSFSFVIDRGEALEALKRFHKHLVDGGQLIIAMFNPVVPKWATQDGRIESGPSLTLEDGRKGVISCMIDNDYTNQLKYGTNRYEIYRNDVLERSEIQEIILRWYSRYEFTLLLEKSGFRDIEVSGDFKDEELSDKHYYAIYCAKK